MKPFGHPLDKEEPDEILSDTLEEYLNTTEGRQQYIKDCKALEQQQIDADAEQLTSNIRIMKKRESYNNKHKGLS